MSLTTWSMIMMIMVMIIVSMIEWSYTNVLFCLLVCFFVCLFVCLFTCLLGCMTFPQQVGSLASFHWLFVSLLACLFVSLPHRPLVYICVLPHKNHPRLTWLRHFVSKRHPKEVMVSTCQHNWKKEFWKS